MQTDLLLRRLAALRVADLLPLLGAEGATIVRVEAPELASRAVRLDLVLHLRSPQGDEYLHLVEWQGYHKADLLWRTMRFLAELHEHRPRLPIRCTIIYLSRGDDVGAMIGVDAAQGGWSFQVQPVRLWDLDARIFATDAAPGLAVLTPIMRGADADLVMQVARRVVSETTAEEQIELVAMLSVFAERLMDSATLIELVGKERIMTSGMIGLLVDEQVAEKMILLEQQAATKAAMIAQQAAEKTAALEAELRAERTARAQQIQVLMHTTIAELVVARFPSFPYATVQTLQTIADVERLQALFQQLLKVDTEAAAIAAIHAAAQPA
jgi:hypothetical protein